MAPNMSICEQLLPFFDDYQRDDSVDTLMYVKQIQEVVVQSGLEQLQLDTSNNHKASASELVTAALLHFLDNALASPVDCKEAVDRVLELIAAFSVSHSSDVTGIILHHAMEGTTVILERVRATSCRMIGWIAKYLMLSSQQSANKNKWLDDASQCLIPRFTDKSQIVRCAAVTASAHFFNDTITDPDLLQSLFFVCQHDPSATNRVAAIQALLPIMTVATVDAWVLRVRDTKSKVRTAALQALVNAPWDLMEANVCATILKSGYTERCEATKEATIQLVCLGWMKAVGYDLIKLLERLNVTLFELQCETALQIVLETTDAVLEPLSRLEIQAFRNSARKSMAVLTDKTQQLSVEQLFLTRVMYRQKDSSSLPDLDMGVLCQLLESHALHLVNAIDHDQELEMDKYACISQSLLKLATAGEMEEGSRRRLQSVLKGMLSSVLLPEDLVEACLESLRIINDKRDVAFLEAIQDILSGLRTTEVPELADNTTLRILSILTVVLEHSTACSARMLALTEPVVPALTHSNSWIREAAVNCVGRLGLIHPATITEHTSSLLEIAHNDESAETRSQALLALSDWSMVSSDVLQCTTNDKMTLPSLISENLISEDLLVICVAAEVAIKLLFARKVFNSSWFAQLVMLSFDSRLAAELDDDAFDITHVGSPVRLQQLLSVFFPMYCAASDTGHEAVLGCIGTMLERVHAKKGSWPVAKMVAYVCDAVVSGMQQQRGVVEETEGSDSKEIDTSLVDVLAAVQVAEYLTRSHDGLGVMKLRALCKVLGSLDVDPTKGPRKSVALLKGLLEELGMGITDASSLRSIQPLNDLMAQVIVESSDEEEEDVGGVSPSKSSTDGSDDGSVAAQDDASLAKAFDKIEIETDPQASPVVADKENQDRRSSCVNSIASEETMTPDIPVVERRTAKRITRTTKSTETSITDSSPPIEQVGLRRRRRRAVN